MWKMYIRSANFASCDVNSIGAQHATKAAWYVTCNSRDCCASEMACVEKVTDLCSCSEWLRRTSIVCAERVCVCVCYLLSVCLWATTRLKCDHASCFPVWVYVCVYVCVLCVLVCLGFGANVLGVQCIALCASIAFSLLCFFFVQCVHTHTRETMCAQMHVNKAAVIVNSVLLLLCTWNDFGLRYIPLEFWYGEFD